MRPLHVLLLVVALAALLVTLLFVVGTGTPAGQVDGVLSDRTDAKPLLHGDATLTAGDPNDPSTLRATPTSGDPSGGLNGPTSGVSGRVVGQSGKPVANALVYAAPLSSLGSMAIDASDPDTIRMAKRVETRSGADGKFLVRPAGQSSVLIGVRASGFAPLDMQRSISGAFTELGDLVLEQGVVLKGRVLDAGGRGVDKAELYLVRADEGPFSAFSGRSGAPLATCDAQGRFVIDMLTNGPWKLRVTSEDHPDHVESGQTERPGQTVSDLSFVLEPGLEISGRVLGGKPEEFARLSVYAMPRPDGSEESAPNGAPIVSAGDAFSQSRKARCGADGSFRVRGCRSGTYRLAAREGDGGFFGDPRSSAVTAKAGDRNVTLELKAQSALVFQVIDARTEAPIEELQVEAGYRWTQPFTDDKGQNTTHFPGGKVRYARLPRGPAGEPLTLQVQATGYAAFERKDLHPLEGQDLDLGLIRLDPVPVCRVTVLDQAGAPVAGAEATLREFRPPARNGDGRRMSVRLAGPSSTPQIDDGSGAASTRGTSGADGVARLTSMPGKQVVLSVRHAGHAPYAGAAFMLPLVGDQDQSVRLSIGGSVLVSVVDSAGRPVASAEILHDGPGGGEQHDLFGTSEPKSDLRGEYLFTHLAPGSHRFRLPNASGGGLLHMGGTVMKLALPGGDPAASDAGWVGVEVVEQTESAVKLIAPTRALITGNVREGGKPLAGAGISLTKRGAEELGLGLAMFGGDDVQRSNGSGEYRLENVEVGDYDVHVTHPNRAMTWDGELSVREGENPWDIELPLSIVEGRVLGPDDKPIAGVRVRAERAQEAAPHGQRRMSFMISTASDQDDEPTIFTSNGAGAESVLTDEQGRYRLRGVTSDVEIVVKAGGKQVQPGQTEPFKLSANQTKTGVDLKLELGGTIEVTAIKANGAPARNLLVFANPAEGGENDEPKSAMTGPSGVAKLTGMKAGKWTIRVDVIGQPGDGPDAPPKNEKQVDVTAGQTSKVRFDLP